MEYFHIFWLIIPKIVGMPFYRTDGSGLVDGMLGIGL